MMEMDIYKLTVEDLITFPNDLILWSTISTETNLATFEIKYIFISVTVLNKFWNDFN